MAYPWLINGGDPNHLRRVRHGMILQVISTARDPLLSEVFLLFGSLCGVANVWVEIP